MLRVTPGITRPLRVTPGITRPWRILDHGDDFPRRGADRSPGQRAARVAGSRRRAAAELTGYGKSCSGHKEKPPYHEDEEEEHEWGDRRPRARPKKVGRIFGPRRRISAVPDW